MIDVGGDYQTAERMAAKLRAIPLPKDLTGKTVLDLGCDHGWWCKLASDRGADRVLGVDRGRFVRGAGNVDLVARNREQGWDRCEFQHANLGTEWPDFGEFDVVLCLALYHHLYAETGEHYRIWRWLRKHTREVLLWEGPVDRRDGVAKSLMQKHQDFTRSAIYDAASTFFTVKAVGPAIYRPFREVWRCEPPNRE